MTPEQRAAHQRMVSTLPTKTHVRMADPHTITGTMVEYWRELHKQGNSYQEIATQHGKTKNTVMDYCNGKRKCFGST